MPLLNMHLLSKLNFLVKNVMLFAFISVGANIAFAQSSVTFEAFADAEAVPLNGYFEVSFTLKNANGTSFTPPDFKNFNILSGPNTSNSMQIVNNQVAREMSHSYTLQPKKLGTFRIGEASIRANGKKLKTKPLTVKVVKGSATASAKGEGEVYVKVEPSKTEAFLGEQIQLNFKLYTTVSLDRYEFADEADYRGFFAHELRRFDSRTRREVVDGKQVTTKVLRSIALFPQQTGKLTIPAIDIRLSVVKDSEQRGFFFGREVRPVFITTDPVEINVKSLPANAPPTFSGGVGSFEMQSSVTRREATTDDAVSVTMLIEGQGDLKRVQAPELMLSDSFEVYPAKVVEEKNYEQQGRLMGKKIIEYLVLPKYPGSYFIQPEFSFFDTENGAYQTLTSDAYPLRVSRGTDRHTSVRGMPDDEAAVGDIRFIKIKSDLQRPGSQFIGSPVFWTLTALPVAAFIGLFFFKKGKERMANIDPMVLRNKLASKEAQKRLAFARRHLDAGNSRAFYDEVSKASLGYVCDKLDIPRSELSKENVREKLQSLSVSPSLVEDLVKVIQTCEMALFAGMDNSAAMQDTYEKAMAAISGIEKEIGK